MWDVVKVIILFYVVKAVVMRIVKCYQWFVLWRLNQQLEAQSKEMNEIYRQLMEHHKAKTRGTK